MSDTDTIRRLMEKGVNVLHPQSVYIAPEVKLERIAPGVTIHPGCRISGPETFIMTGCVIGREAPATIDNCHLAAGVELKGGYFKASAFLDKANMASGAHVREACLLEEEAGGAHTVGLKHTILLPFVTLGSLINLCDCLVSGGTSRKDHSEVGSSYIHFNYTPQQDKATPSLIGDVPRGVMLRERPIFLGGQGDLADGRLVRGNKAQDSERAFIPGMYGKIRARVAHNIQYIANLMALKSWYTNVRALFLDPVILSAALDVLNAAIDERIARLDALAKQMPESIKRAQAEPARALTPQGARDMNAFEHAWPRVEEALRTPREHGGEGHLRDAFLTELGRSRGPYIAAIKDLPEGACRTGTLWLSELVEAIRASALESLPGFSAPEP